MLRNSWDYAKQLEGSKAMAIELDEIFFNCKKSQQYLKCICEYSTQADSCRFFSLIAVMLYKSFEKLLKYLEQILKIWSGEFEQIQEGKFADNGVFENFHLKNCSCKRGQSWPSQMCWQFCWIICSNCRVICSCVRGSTYYPWFQNSGFPSGGTTAQSCTFTFSRISNGKVWSVN